MANREQVNNIYKGILHRAGDEGGLNNYAGRDANLIVQEMLNSQERKNLEAHFNGLTNKANELQAIVNQLSTRPTKEEYARVQVQLNDKVAEITAAQAALEAERKKVKIETVYTHDEETKANVSAILKLVKTIRALILNLFKKKG